VWKRVGGLVEGEKRESDEWSRAGLQVPVDLAHSLRAPPLPHTPHPTNQFASVPVPRLSRFPWGPQNQGNGRVWRQGMGESASGRKSATLGRGSGWSE